MASRSRRIRAQHEPAGRAGHACPACALPFVQFEPLADESEAWRVAMWCPNCGWRAEALLGQAALERLDEELDRGTEELMASLAAVTAHNMSEYVDRFTAALACDAILPGDF